MGRSFTGRAYLWNGKQVDAVPKAGSLHVGCQPAIVERVCLTSIWSHKHTAVAHNVAVQCSVHPAADTHESFLSHNL